MRVLIIDDEKIFLKKIASNFTKENWTIDLALNYNSAYENIKDKKYDIIICDYCFGSPKIKNGLDLIKQIRKEGNSVPVILLTGKDLDKITPWTALESGFDDFLKKPFEPKELKARILAIIRRKNLGLENFSNSIFFKDLEINFITRKIISKGEEIKLGNTLFLLTYELIKNKNKLVKYEDLIEYLWGESFFYNSESTPKIRVNVSRLKKIIGGNFGESIKTIHGIGYILQE